MKNKKIKSTEIRGSLQSAEIERQRLESLINSMVDGVVATDTSGKIILYNAAALGIFDTNKTLKGVNLNEVCTLVDKNNQALDLKKYLAEAHTQKTSRDFKFVYPDKSFVSLYFSVSPIRLGYGKNENQGYIIVLRDITHEKSLEEERDEFISVVSHELRTPIAIAEGEVSNAEFLANKSGVKNQISDALKAAHDQILFLSGMINDLSTLSRAERGKLAVEPEPINCVELLKELEIDYKPQAEEKKLELKTNLAPHLEMLVSAKLYVREILQNFITNAIKYTEKGSVVVAAKPYDGGVEFEVTDTGIGISKGDQEKVFDKFFRSEDYRTRQNNGTGLGLYVTLKLARLINADISLESVLNEGSTFIIKIPNIKQKPK